MLLMLSSKRSKVSLSFPVTNPNGDSQTNQPVEVGQGREDVNALLRRTSITPRAQGTMKQMQVGGVGISDATCIEPTLC